MEKNLCFTRKSNLIGYELVMYMEKSPYMQGEILSYKEKTFSI